jgi:tRNA(Ile)-lysidine synthase TilS/MesJ
MRGDVSRLQRCTAIQTSTDETIPRSKPFKYTYEKEIVMYAYQKKLEYFSTECIYSPNAYRGHARTFLKDLESIRFVWSGFTVGHLRFWILFIQENLTKARIIILPALHLNPLDLVNVVDTCLPTSCARRV